MFGIFSAIQFTNLAALFVGLAAPLLIFAYLRKRHQAPKVVSSILILKTLKRRPTLKRRFKPPLRFFLELLALLLLTAAAAWPLYKREGRRVAVLLDNTMSMRAREDAVSDISRLNIALSRTREWLNGQDRENDYTLFLSAPSLQKFGEENISESQLTALLQTVTTVLSGDTLAASVKELGESGDYDKVLVVSDKQLEYSDDAGLPSSDGPSSETVVTAITVGELVPNVFISNARIDRSRQGKTTVVIGVGVSNKNPQRVEVVISRVSKGKNPTRTPLVRKTVRGIPGEIYDLAIALPSSVSPSSLLEATITSSENDSRNSLPEDDSAWLTLNSTGDTRVLLVTPSPQAASTGLGLSSLGYLNVTTIRPSKFQTYSKEALKEFMLLIFHQTAPAATPQVPTLLILPPDENSVFPVLKVVSKPRITSWADDHPITTYLKVPFLKPTAGLVFDTPSWTKSVINTEPGSILVAGESQGVRFAASGMELLPFEGAKTPALSILTLNILRWLTSSETLSAGKLTESSLRLEGEKSWVILDPNGEFHQFRTDKDSPNSYRFELPGVYYVTEISGTSRATLEKIIRTVAVNTFYPQESVTYSRGTFQAAPTYKHTGSNARVGRPLWPFLLQLVLLVLLAELALRFFTVHKQKNQEVLDGLPG